MISIDWQLGIDVVKQVSRALFVPGFNVARVPKMRAGGVPMTLEEGVARHQNGRTLCRHPEGGRRPRLEGWLQAMNMHPSRLARRRSNCSA